MPTLLVSCTDRKTLKTSKSLELRALPKRHSVDTAAEIWSQSMTVARNSAATSTLRNLYAGEYWKTALEAEGRASLLVASAGLGLLSPDSHAPGYAATFASGSPDSVLRFGGGEASESVRSDWWSALASNGLGNENWTRKTSEVVLVAMSSSYQQALSEDFKKIARTGKQVIVMSGSRQVGSLRDIDNIHHVETGQWLRMVLGGSTPCVGIKFALHILQADKWHSVDEIETELKKLERKYSNGKTDKLPVFDRTPRTDAEVKSWIMQLLNTKKKDGVKPSKSGFLLEFRNTGYACEQKRFGALFEEVLGK
jgi:hypothetical protein